MGIRELFDKIIQECVTAIGDNAFVIFEAAILMKGMLLEYQKLVKTLASHLDIKLDIQFNKNVFSDAVILQKQAKLPAVGTVSSDSGYEKPHIEQM